MALATALTPLLTTAGIGWLYYRRIRRQFGRQEYRSTRAMFRLAVLCIALLGLAVLAFVSPRVAWGIAAGLLAGGVLGSVALRHTALERTDDGNLWYTPNPWIGGALSLLLVGRLAWRYGSGALTGGSANALRDISPLTLGIAATLVAFYLANGIGLWRRMRALRTGPTTPV
jgi:hypothetical protein